MTTLKEIFLSKEVASQNTFSALLYIVVYPFTVSMPPDRIIGGKLFDSPSRRYDFRD